MKISTTHPHPFLSHPIIPKPMLSQNLTVSSSHKTEQHNEIAKPRKTGPGSPYP